MDSRAIQLGPMIVDDLEVCVVNEATREVSQPTLLERQVLLDYFATPDAYDTRTGKLFHLHGGTCPGIDGLALTYQVVDSGSTSSPSATKKAATE